jgi:hypothetical protein
MNRTDGVQVRGVSSRRGSCLPILVTVALLSLNMPVEEFVAFQRLPDRELKTRLGLPDSCTPRVTARQSGSRQADHVNVEVRCGETGDVGVKQPTMPRVRAGRQQ